MSDMFLNSVSTGSVNATSSTTTKIREDEDNARMLQGVQSVNNTTNSSCFSFPCSLSQSSTSSGNQSSVEMDAGMLTPDEEREMLALLDVGIDMPAMERMLGVNVSRLAQGLDFSTAFSSIDMPATDDGNWDEPQFTEQGNNTLGWTSKKDESSNFSIANSTTEGSEQTYATSSFSLLGTGAEKMHGDGQ